MLGKSIVITVVKAVVHFGVALLGVGLLSCSAICANAQINFVFLPDTETAGPGDLVTYAATITNTGTSTVFLNSPSLSFTGPATPDASLFDTNFNGPLAAGQSITNQGIFTLAVDSNAAPGSYQGTFNILGGPTSNDANKLLAMDQNFALIVQVQGVPESSSLLLLALGLGGLAVVRRISRKARA